ncbi:serine hydroxymethyltransferase [Hoyosella rhizosphaerae]|uniref:Serine hydroxymethyltransferase n=1 Tax=Hoyosella rhizosphaerae TaxID=1755582 RepID=A0A916UEE5_9ACTN|nr:serine hydroxymethyltransferase [Hoyosella rhizosphaerae]MBN4927840.1 serine hydroxymethyltransferase [Hoyosella rhizosphaerae]GGC70377.1 serine hydroxymethyltransferase [Hoyosella rhizosphaerae]
MSTPQWGPNWSALEEIDPEIAGIVLSERDRLNGGLQLIASENFTSPAVLAVLGSTLSNKYAEGYPGNRFYQGCEFVDAAERLAVDRAKELFGANHVNVQPHSGASANLAVYAAFAQPDDPVLALSLPHGGHLTHGARINFSGAWFTAVPYSVNRDTEMIDYDEVRELARLHQPRIIVCGATSYSREMDYAIFREIADEIDAILWVDAAHIMGLVAGQAIPSPVPYADVVTTTTHKTLRGPRGGMILCRTEHAAAIDRAVFPFSQSGPMMHTIAAKAVALQEAATPDFRTYAHSVVENARALSTALEGHGMRPISGGTDTHLVVCDVSALGTDGADAETRCAQANILLNKNAIPFDPLPPRTPSGIRVGTAALTTQGFGRDDMSVVADLIAAAVTAGKPGERVDVSLAEIARQVSEFVADKPAYAVEGIQSLQG